MTFLLALSAGFIAGAISGMGVGGGTLLVIYLTFICGVSQIESQGINLIYFLFCAAPALVFHIKNSLVEIKPALFSIASGVVAAAAGSFLASYIAVSTLRRFFGALLIYIGIKELFFREKPAEKGRAD